MKLAQAELAKLKVYQRMCQYNEAGVCQTLSVVNWASMLSPVSDDDVTLSELTTGNYSSLWAGYLNLSLTDYAQVLVLINRAMSYAHARTHKHTLACSSHQYLTPGAGS